MLTTRWTILSVAQASPLYDTGWLTMRVSPLQAIRISVSNLPAACHFWESTFGFQFAAETEVYDSVLRRLWDAEGGSLRAARLERPGDPYARIELYHWDGCVNEPIRDPRRPWDPGVRELQFHVSDLARTAAHLERIQCRFLEGSSVFVTPFGERCRLVSNGTAAASVALTVASHDEARAFFTGFLGWSCEVRQEGLVPGAASIAGGERLVFSSSGSGFGRVEVSEYRRFADPRVGVPTAARMSPRYTGVWMLTASTDRLPPGDPRIADVDVPFIGRRKAIVGRAPSGVRFGVFEATS